MATGTEIPAEVIPFSDQTDGLIPAYVAAAASMNFINAGNRILVVKNDSVTVPTTVTISAVPDAMGRGGAGNNIVKVLAAGDVAFFGPMRPQGFTQQTAADAGRVLVALSATTDVYVTVLKANV